MAQLQPGGAAEAEFVICDQSIELLFKRLKQLIGLEPVRVRRAAAVAAVLRALLIAWVLEEPSAQELREQLPQWSGMAAGTVSSWEVAGLLTSDLRQVVQGTWTRARLVACLPQLARYLCRTHQRRRLQEPRVWAWLQQMEQRRRRPQWGATGPSSC